MDKRFELTVGPLLFNWTADAIVDFYARVADEAPVERVVVGELVCSKRLPFYEDRMPEVVERLERGGKAVALDLAGAADARARAPGGRANCSSRPGSRSRSTT